MLFAKTRRERGRGHAGGIHAVLPYRKSHGKKVTPPHLTYTLRTVVLSPYAFVTVRDTGYIPGFTNVCEGSCSIEVVPSPKSQCQEVGE